jgi:flagellar L-ring protein FlgH
MKLIINIPMFLLVFSLFSLKAQSQFNQNSSRSLFSDVKAYKEGDALMVLITEDMQANNGAQTSHGRSDQISLGLSMPNIENSNKLNGNLNSGNDFSANGKTSRNERIRTKLSARVVSVDSNGNLQIEGTRTTKINGEVQTITIRGLVRYVDVRPDNSVFSYSILNLTLLIEGDGEISETQDPGIITKFIRFIF